MEYWGKDLYNSAIVKEKYFNSFQTALICYNIAVGLNYLHNSEIIHRDIKPQNILINEKLETIIIDFGLARSMLKPKFL